MEESRARLHSTYGWPAIVFVLLVAAAAVFSFLPRPMPAFPQTAIRPDSLLINGLAASGTRRVAVGDLGHILLADAPGGPWREARIATARGSALTQVAFIDDKTAIAVGHDGWILRSQDRGDSWKEAAFDAQQGNALLGIAGPYDGRVYVFGGFGELQVSDDAGLSWQKISLDEARAAKTPAPAPAKPADPNAFPFGDSASEAAGEDRHVYGLARSDDGSLVLVGEHGLLDRSHDKGNHWEGLPQIYAGSLFGILPLKGNALLAYGMRGNVFRSADGGLHWTKIVVPSSRALYGGTLAANGDVLLVGDAVTVLRSHDNGLGFARVGNEGRKSLSAILQIDGTHWLTGGENGIGQVTVETVAGAAGAAR